MSMLHYTEFEVVMLDYSSPKDMEKVLKEYGDENWEVASMTMYDPANSPKFLVIFQRKRVYGD